MYASLKLKNLREFFSPGFVYTKIIFTDFYVLGMLPALPSSEHFVLSLWEHRPEPFAVRFMAYLYWGVADTNKKVYQGFWILCWPSSVKYKLFKPQELTMAASGHVRQGHG